MVSFNVDVEFEKLPLGASTDKLEDTVCYFDLAKNIKNFCANKKFNLLEHLTAKIHQFISDQLKKNYSQISSIKLTAHKISPPVPDLHGGVTFTYHSKS